MSPSGVISTPPFAPSTAVASARRTLTATVRVPMVVPNDALIRIEAVLAVAVADVKTSSGIVSPLFAVAEPSFTERPLRSGVSMETVSAMLPMPEESPVSRSWNCALSPCATCVSGRSTVSSNAVVVGCGGAPGNPTTARIRRLVSSTALLLVTSASGIVARAFLVANHASCAGTRSLWKGAYFEIRKQVGSPTSRPELRPLESQGYGST